MKKNITTIGGGTGSFVVLSGLKPAGHHLSAVVTTADNGGSSGSLRDDYGVLPPGDIRQCLVALSNAPEDLRKLFLYRFEGGSLHGHNFGNIFIAALEMVNENMEAAIDMAGRILNVEGKVVPVTTTKTDLCVELENGESIEGESHIDEPLHDGALRIERAYLKDMANGPVTEANPTALEVIRSSDMIIMGPGDVYTSLLPVLLVPGVVDAIAQSRAKVVYVMNLMTKYGQTNGMSAQDIIAILEEYIGRDMMKHILINTAPIAEDILTHYGEAKEEPIVDDMGEDPRVWRGQLIDHELYNKPKGDTLRRSVLRHSQERLAQAILSLLHHD